MNLATGFAFNGISTDAAVRTEKRSDGCRNAASHPVVMRLDLSRVAVLRTDGPVEITCASGQLWITIPGVVEDVVLQPGQCHRLTGALDDVLISAVGERSPATFGLRPLRKESRSSWLFGSRTAASHFQLEFA